MKTSVAIAVSLILATGVALADKKKKESASTGSSAPAVVLSEEHERAFQALDLDGDGAISLAEAAGNREIVTRFDRADRNRDGKLSRAEYEAMWKAKARPKSRQARAEASPK